MPGILAEIVQKLGFLNKSIKKKPKLYYIIRYGNDKK